MVGGSVGPLFGPLHTFDQGLLADKFGLVLDRIGHGHGDPLEGARFGAGFGGGEDITGIGQGLHGGAHQVCG